MFHILSVPYSAVVNKQHIDATGFIYLGYTAGQIANRIHNIPLTGATVIHAGTNNLVAQPLAKCMAELRGGPMESVHNQNPDSFMIVCEIPYRYDEAELNDKVDRVNICNFLKCLCQARPTCHLLPHDYNHEDRIPKTGYTSVERQNWSVRSGGCSATLTH